MKILVSHDRKADVVYLRFSGEKVESSRKLDPERIIDYSQDGEIRGIRFVAAHAGLNTEDLPHRSAIERALRDNGFVRRLPGHSGETPAAESRTDSASAKVRQGTAKATLLSISRAAAAILIFIGCTTASVILARNLFLLESPPELVASLYGLVIALFVPVLGCLILLAWALDVSINIRVRGKTPRVPDRRSPTRTKQDQG